MLQIQDSPLSQAAVSLSMSRQFTNYVFFSKSFKFRGEQGFVPVTMNFMSLKQTFCVHINTCAHRVAGTLYPMCLVTCMLSQAGPEVHSTSIHTAPLMQTAPSKQCLRALKSSGPCQRPHVENAGNPGTLRRLTLAFCWGRGHPASFSVGESVVQVPAGSEQCVYFQLLLRGRDPLGGKVFLLLCWPCSVLFARETTDQPLTSLLLTSLSSVR